MNIIFKIQAHNAEGTVHIGPYFKTVHLSTSKKYFDMLNRRGLRPLVWWQTDETSKPYVLCD